MLKPPGCVCVKNASAIDNASGLATTAILGGGGRELGCRLAEKLHMEYYDKEIITEISKRTSLSEKYIQEVMEQKPHPLFPITIGRSFFYMETPVFKLTQSVYQEQSRIIREMASKSDCVIVVRSAYYQSKDQCHLQLFSLEMYLYIRVE